jgi:Ca2+-binding EF-hand superfamily protein
MFLRFSQGKDTIVISEVFSQRTPDIQQRMTEFAKRNGITNGQLNRDQFSKYMQEQMANFGPRGGGPPQAAPVDDNAIRDAFRALDKNNDGVLSKDEMPEDLRAQLDRWDTNKDGSISFEEFKEYYKNKAQPGAQPGATPEDEADKKPTIYHAGNLPKELAWFAQLDTDHDGQIGLYEWKAAGRDVNQFYEMDLNRDGFLTVEEVLRYQKAQEKNQGKDAMGNPIAGGPPGGFPGGGFPGGGGPSWNPQGGFPGGGGPSWNPQGGGGDRPRPGGPDRGGKDRPPRGDKGGGKGRPPGGG